MVLGRNYYWRVPKSFFTPAPVRPHTVKGAPHNTTPTSTSAASLYLSNWSNIQALWDGSQLKQLATATYGPRIAAAHTLRIGGVNQINDYTGFFRDTTDNGEVRPPQDFTSTAYLGRKNGVLHGSYGTYTDLRLLSRMSEISSWFRTSRSWVVKYTVEPTLPQRRHTTGTSSTKVACQQHELSAQCRWEL